MSSILSSPLLYAVDLLNDVKPNAWSRNAIFFSLITSNSSNLYSSALLIAPSFLPRKYQRGRTRVFRLSFRHRLFSRTGRCSAFRFPHRRNSLFSSWLLFFRVINTINLSHIAVRLWRRPVVPATAIGEGGGLNCFRFFSTLHFI